jgi:hypothetical protein
MVRVGAGLSHVDASTELATVCFWDGPVHGFEMLGTNEIVV